MSNLKARFENLITDESIPVSDGVKAFLDKCEEADEDLRWLVCLESAGVDNWSGIDFAHELLGESYELCTFK